MFKKKNRKGNYPKCLTKTEKISLIYLLLEDIKQDKDFNLDSRINRIKELLKEIEIHDTTNIKDCNLSDDYILEIFYIMNQPSLLMTKEEYKKIRKRWNTLE